jgi:hypothetical protein
MRKSDLIIIRDDETSNNLFIDRLLRVAHDWTWVKLSIVRLNETTLVMVITMKTNSTTCRMNFNVFGILTLFIIVVLSFNFLLVPLELELVVD